MNKRFLICLSGGGGDQQITLVDPTAQAWIESDYPEFPPGQTSVEEEIPVACRYTLKEGAEYDEDNPSHIWVTSGSYDNDRALACRGQDFGSIREVMKYIKANKIELVGEYTGYIY